MGSQVIVSSWDYCPKFLSHEFRPFGRGPITPGIGGLMIAMVIIDLLTGRLLQVELWSQTD